MPENTVTTPLAPMEPDDIAGAFAYIQAIHAADIDTACTVADDTGPELHRLLLDVAARVFIPITAADDHDGEPCAHSFLAAALGRLLLELLCHSVCLAGARGMAQTIILFTENILTEDHSDVADLLRRLEAAGMKQAMEAAPGAPDHRVAAPPERWWCGAARVPGAPPWCAPPHHGGPPAPHHAHPVRTRCDDGVGGARTGAPHTHRGARHRPQRTAPGACHSRAGSYITRPLDRDLAESPHRAWQGET